jgi:glycerol-3-phosphate dehydrogenase
MLVVAIPSQFIRGSLKKFHGMAFENVLLVNVAKGVENGTLMTMSEMLHDTLRAKSCRRGQQAYPDHRGCGFDVV